MILYKYHKNIFENIKTEVKIRIFTPLITSWLGFGDFQQNQENSDMIRKKQKFGKFKYYLSFDGCIVQSHFPVCPRELDHHKR